MGNTNPPKTKIFVILGSDIHRAAYAYVFINSTINFNVINSPKLRALQHSITQLNNPFLTHDSVVDCSDVKQYIDCTRLDGEVLANPAYNHGTLSADDLQSVLNMVRTASTTIPAFVNAYRFRQ